jgi:DNA-binding transcriptional MerR regulator
VRRSCCWDAEEEEEENGDSSEEEECEEEKEVKKSKAEAMLERLLCARSAKRRAMVREAMDEVPEVGGADSIKDAVKAAVEELLGMPLDEVKKLLSQEKSEPEHGAEEVALMVDDVDADDMQLSDDLANALDEPMPAEEMDVEDGVITASDRRAWRAKVAAETGSKYQLSLTPAVTVDTDMPLQESHALEGLDTKTPEANVEGIVEMHEKIMKQVQSLPKVREAMEHIGSLLKSGKLNVNELDDSAKLQALAVDPAAAKYYKDYFGQGDAESKKFGNDLVQDYSNKKKEASLDESRAKMRIAYDMALEMQEKGMINSDTMTLHAQVDEIMKFDDRAFASYKKALSRVSRPVKTASASVPALQVGVNNEDAVQAQETTIVDQLKKMW